MIPRYSRPEMAAIWSPETRFRIWFEIEAHAADAMAKLGIVPKAAVKKIWDKGSKATFDVAYFSIFKCNKKRIADYPNLENYMRELYQVPGVAGTVTPRYYVINYYSIPKVNPTLIIPKGTPVDLGQPHDRARLAA